jgi:hypothetical protein
MDKTQKELQLGGGAATDKKPSFLQQEGLQKR